MQHKDHHLVLSLALLAVAPFLAAASGSAQVAPRQLVLHAWDAGHGHCSLVQCPEGAFILVDCGSEEGGDPRRIRAEVAKVIHHRPIATVVATHPSAPHTSFIPQVLDGVHVERILLGGTRKDYSLPFQTWLRQAETRGAKVQTLPSGHRDPVSSPTSLTCGGATTHVLAANVGEESALVLRFEVRRSPKESWRLILSGAARKATREAVLRDYPADFLRTDVLQLANRGGTGANHGKWFAALHPAYVFASAGKEPQTDPDCATIGRAEVEVSQTACHTLSCGGKEAASRCKSSGQPPWCTFPTRKAIFSTIDQGDLRFVLSKDATTIGIVPAKRLWCPES